MSESTNKYAPVLVSPPGQTLKETLDALGMTQVDLAIRTGKPKKTINEIIRGKAGITPEIALQFERVLGVPSEFWNSRERMYRDSLVRQRERNALKQRIAWLNKMPISAMVKAGWIEKKTDKVEQLRETLNFFGVASPKQWQEKLKETQAAWFRVSTAFEVDKAALAAWMRKGRLEAQQVSCRSFNEAQFKQSLDEIRSLTPEPPEVFQEEMHKLCAQSGVAVVFVPELPKTRVSGATRWLSPELALIQLSLRYKTDDHLWFTFFHEAGHILLHGKTEIFLESWEKVPDPKEEEANRFASNHLIPTAKLKQFISSTRVFSKRIIQEFAEELKISPGIVVGRLQHDGIIPHYQCNALKRRFVLKPETE